MAIISPGCNPVNSNLSKIPPRLRRAPDQPDQTSPLMPSTPALLIDRSALAPGENQPNSPARDIFQEHGSSKATLTGKAIPYPMPQGPSNVAIQRVVLPSRGTCDLWAILALPES